MTKSRTGNISNIWHIHCSFKFPTWWALLLISFIIRFVIRICLILCLSIVKTHVWQVWNKYLSSMEQIFVKGGRNVCQVWNKYLSSVGEMFVKCGTNIWQVWNKYLTSVEQIFVKCETNICQVWNKYLSSVEQIERDNVLPGQLGCFSLIKWGTGWGLEHLIVKWLNIYILL